MQASTLPTFSTEPEGDDPSNWLVAKGLKDYRAGWVPSAWASTRGVHRALLAQPRTNRD
jgi:hypothetical protein